MHIKYPSLDMLALIEAIDAKRLKNAIVRLSIVIAYVFLFLNITNFHESMTFLFFSRLFVWGTTHLHPKAYDVSWVIIMTSKRWIFMNLLWLNLRFHSRKLKRMDLVSLSYWITILQWNDNSFEMTCFYKLTTMI